MAMNPMLANSLIWDIQEAYHIIDNEITEKAEDGNDGRN